MMKILAKILPALAGGLMLAGVGSAGPAAAQDQALLVDWKPRGGYYYDPPPYRYRGPPPRYYRGPPPRAYYPPPPPVYYAPPPPPRYYRPAPPPGVGLYFRF
jgi:hypothetical protein